MEIINIVSRCEKEGFPLSHLLTKKKGFYFSSEYPPARLSHISFHAQFRSERSEARMFEHGMICGRGGRERYERPARMFEQGMIYRRVGPVSGKYVND